MLTRQQDVQKVVASEAAERAAGQEMLSFDINVANPILNHPQIAIFMGCISHPPNGKFVALGFPH